MKNGFQENLLKNRAKNRKEGQQQINGKEK